MPVTSVAEWLAENPSALWAAWVLVYPVVWVSGVLGGGGEALRSNWVVNAGGAAGTAALILVVPRLFEETERLVRADIDVLHRGVQKLYIDDLESTPDAPDLDSRLLFGACIGIPVALTIWTIRRAAERCVGGPLDCQVGVASPYLGQPWGAINSLAAWIPWTFLLAAALVLLVHFLHRWSFLRHAVERSPIPHLETDGGPGPADKDAFAEWETRWALYKDGLREISTVTFWAWVGLAVAAAVSTWLWSRIARADTATITATFVAINAGVLLVAVVFFFRSPFFATWMKIRRMKDVLDDELQRMLEGSLQPDGEDEGRFPGVGVELLDHRNRSVLSARQGNPMAGAVALGLYLAQEVLNSLILA